MATVQPAHNLFHLLLICLISIVIFLISCAIVTVYLCDLCHCPALWDFFFVCSGSDRPRCRSSRKESFQIPCRPCSWRPSPDSTYSPLPRASLGAVTRTAGGKTANRLDRRNPLSYSYIGRNKNKLSTFLKDQCVKFGFIYESYIGKEKKKLKILPIKKWIKCVLQYSTLKVIWFSILRPGLIYISKNIHRSRVFFFFNRTLLKMWKYRFSKKIMNTD